MPTTTSTYKKCPWTCELTNDAGYVVYSALGSFYIPMLVMLFFYWRIYRAAIRTTRAINQGFRTTKGERESEIHLYKHRHINTLIFDAFSYIYIFMYEMCTSGIFFLFALLSCVTCIHNLP
jgi:hypothetical protein